MKENLTLIDIRCHKTLLKKRIQMELESFYTQTGVFISEIEIVRNIVADTKCGPSAIVEINAVIKL